MKLMFPEKLCVRSIVALVALLVSFSLATDAQSRRKAVNKPTVVKKSETQAKDAKKDKDHEKGKIADAKSRKDPKKIAAEKRAALERRQREEEHRQAILVERRRREQAAREARARRIAFERGLRTETVANISKDVTAGEDLNIRAAAVNALGSHAGSVVVMEAQTGKVLTIVNQDWAIRSSIKPCSTIKLVTGVAGLNEGLISRDDGSIRNTSTRRNLDDAVAFSDNGYFQRVGSNLGSTKLIEYEKDLGLGEPTGLNTTGETGGKLPYGNNNARIYSHGDGTEVSTLQLAVLVSAITNGGKRVLPRIPRNTVEQTNFQTFYRAKIDLPQQNVRRMIPGMMGAAEYGTAHRGVDASQGIAGKTGSCIDKGSWVGLFASVAPIEKPKYAVAVITRGERERGKYAAAVAGQVYRALGRQIVRTDRNLAQTEFKLRPKSSVDPRTAVKLVDAEGEDESAIAGDADMASDGRDVIMVPSVPKQSAPKKLINKTVDSHPIFPPVVITYDKDGKEIIRSPGSKPE